MYLSGTPIWRPENSVKIWNLLWLSRRLIISTEKTSIYISTFPNALVSPNFRYSSKCFTEIYRAQYEIAILVYLSGTPIWRPENSVKIWNLLWLSRRLIISTEKTSIYISTFPNALTSKRAQNHEISIYF